MVLPTTASPTFFLGRNTLLMSQFSFSSRRPPLRFRARPTSLLSSVAQHTAHQALRSQVDAYAFIGSPTPTGVRKRQRGYCCHRRTAQFTDELKW